MLPKTKITQVEGLETSLGELESAISSFGSPVDENSVLTYAGSNLTNVKEYWPDGTTLKTDITLSYTDSNLTGVVTLRYSDLGALLTTITETLIYTSGVLTSVERTVA